MYYQNSRGLKTKTSAFYSSCVSCDYDIICLTETWLNSTVHDSELFSDSFIVYRHDRSLLNSSKSDGGGVLIGVRKSINSQLINIPNSDSIESICVKSSFKNVNIYLYGLYIPPNSNEQCFKEHMAALMYLSDILTDTDIIFVIGDFNMSSIEWIVDDDNINVLLPTNIPSSYVDILDLIMEMGLSQMNHIVNHQNKLLDLFFTNITDDSSVCGSNIPMTKVDVYHPPIEILHTLSQQFLPSTGINYEYNFNKTDFTGLANYLNNINWHLEFSNKSCMEQLVEKFYDITFTGFDFFIPKYRKKVNSHPPWFTKELLSIKNRKSKKHKIYLKTKTDNDYQIYQTVRREFDILADHLYKSYILDIQENVKTNPKCFWKYTKMKRKTNGFPSTMHLEGNRVSGCADISDLFANFFESVYNDSPVLYNSSNKTSPITFGSLCLTLVDICQALEQLDVRKGSGPDGIPPVILQKCSTAFSTPLCIIFNTSLILGIFPEKWKLSHLIPIFKSGTRANIENYRGVAISSSIPKLFESLVCDALYNEVKNYLSPDQHGFVKNRSVSSNLVEFTNIAIPHIEKGFQVDTIFTDFTKAFDRVNIKVIVQKLKELGVHSAILLWIESFLTNRKQYVKINESKSRSFLVKSGVPQGSHIGPLLFVLFINDVSSIFKFAECRMYADDLKIFAIIKNQHDQSRFQADINIFSEWCNNSGLILNAGKCKSMTFSRSRNCLPSSYFISHNVLEKVTIFKDLGVVLDSKLSFNFHIDYAVSKSYSMLGFIMRQAWNFTDPYSLKSLYCSLVRPHLEYAMVVWNPAFAVHSARIESIQKKFLKYALRKIGWTDRLVLPSYVSRCLLIDLETLELRRKIACCVLIYDIINSNIDSSLLLSKINFHVPNRTLRRHLLFRVESCRTAYGSREAVKTGMRLLAPLALDVDIAESNRGKLRRCLKEAFAR